MIDNDKIYLLFGDLNQYPVIGQGKFGTVYRLNDQSCLKINYDTKNNKKEVKLHKKYSHSPLFPRMYGYGRNYIIMEYIKGTSLAVFLDQGLTLDDGKMRSLLTMFQEAEKTGLSLNPNARHVIFDRYDSVRLVDLEDLAKFASPKPFMLFNRLKKYGQKELFLSFVEQHDPALYKNWTSRSKKNN